MSALTGFARRHLSLAARRRIALRRLAYRRPTARWRLLPDFLLIGGQRCGTSSLYKYLCQHPSVGRPLRKEIEYFSTSFHQGEAWYRAHFPLAVSRRLARLFGRGLHTFEATPDYLLVPQAAERAAQLVPRAKIVVLLREPVARAYSHYRHLRRLDMEELSFEEAIAAEPERLAGELARLAAEPTYKARQLRLYSYLERGRYARHLAPWLTLYPAEQLLILRSEDFFADLPGVFGQIVEFLGLPPFLPSAFRNWSYAEGKAEAAPDLSPELAARLRAQLAPDNQRLYELLGRDLDW